VHFEKLIVTQLIKKFRARYGASYTLV